MCTAIADGRRGIFGRTLDVARDFGAEAVLLPRDCPLPWESGRHFAIVGVGRMEGEAPLLFDGMNEKGLWGAALRYPDAVWGGGEGREVPSFALLSHVLGRCASLCEARALLCGIRVTGEAFSPALPPSPLHFIFADETGALVAEPEEGGLRLWENAVGVLANAPAFPSQMAHLSLYSHLGSGPSPRRLCAAPLSRVSGSDSFGLPGDFTSPSRFVRAAFYLHHLKGEGIPFGLRVLGGVSVPEGAVETEEGAHFTAYTSVADRTGGRYAVLPARALRPRLLSLRDREEGNRPRHFSLPREEEWEEFQ